MSAGVDGKDFLRPHILDLDPYTPILPINIIAGSIQPLYLYFLTLVNILEQLGMNMDDIAKLDANENPYGPSTGVKLNLNTIIFNFVFQVSWKP